MTCIAAVEAHFKVYMAGDSAITYGDGTYSTAAPKVIKRGGIVLGAAGDARGCDQVLAVDWPRYDGTRPSRWITRELWPVLVDRCPRLRKLELIVGVGGEIYLLDSGGAVMRPRAGYAAIGSGSDLALWSLYTSAAGRPKRRLRTALEAAAAARSDVAPPWRFVVA